jgi:hypothetical protein
MPASLARSVGSNGPRPSTAVPSGAASAQRQHGAPAGTLELQHEGPTMRRSQPAGRRLPRSRGGELVDPGDGEPDARQPHERGPDELGRRRTSRDRHGDARGDQEDTAAGCWTARTEAPPRPAAGTSAVIAAVGCVAGADHIDRWAVGRSWPLAVAALRGPGRPAGHASASGPATVATGAAVHDSGGGRVCRERSVGALACVRRGQPIVSTLPAVRRRWRRG